MDDRSLRMVVSSTTCDLSLVCRASPRDPESDLEDTYTLWDVQVSGRNPRSSRHGSKAIVPGARPVADAGISFESRDKRINDQINSLRLHLLDTCFNL
jgi:hypothetical protein